MLGTPVNPLCMEARLFRQISVELPVVSGGKLGPSSYGKTDAEGRYSLKLVTNDKEGAMVGDHKVMIRLTGTEESDEEDADASPADPDKATDTLPPRYNDETELKMNVPSGGTDSANFDLVSN